MVLPADGTVASGDELIYKLFVRGKAVHDNTKPLFDLVFDVLTRADLSNQKRIVEMLKESKAGMEADLATSGVWCACVCCLCERERVLWVRDEKTVVPVDYSDTHTHHCETSGEREKVIF